MQKKEICSPCWSTPAKMSIVPVCSESTELSMAGGFQYVSKLPPANDFPGAGKSDREIAHPCLPGHRTVKPHLGGHVSTVAVINTDCFGAGQSRCVHCAVSLCSKSLLFCTSMVLLSTKTCCLVWLGHKNGAACVRDDGTKCSSDI